jgi:polyferredoxin
MAALRNRQIILLGILAFNLVSTFFHFTDNALFLDQYPGPDWFTPASVWIAWFIMAPFALLGYWLYVKQQFWAAYCCLGFYSITGLSSLGHYLFPAIEPLSFKMHSLIWSDAIAGATLAGFILWSVFQTAVIGEKSVREKS